ncbi:MAG: DEAD/DEAH box helicase [Treponema sp.]|nr:DEAD/DEAH box helicase [Treponema sp.]
MLPKTFHPVIKSWFTETFSKPTSVQAEAWPLIEEGKNVLAIAPTGSGKTLTAFLCAVSRFCSEGKDRYKPEKLSVLYISPLKALNEDIKRNLLIPLAAIKARFEKEGKEFPPVRVETRSGDTPQSQRRRFLTHPPSILALTPESLSIILHNPKGRQVLSNVKYLIIDEIHAVLGNKRGSFLSCQIDRLSLIAGEFQRISLSATVRNPRAAAEFTGGIFIDPSQTGSIVKNAVFRNVNIVSPFAEKKIDFKVEYPEIEIETANFTTGSKSRYTPLVNYIIRRIWEGSTLLVFAESRRRAERLSHFINEEGASYFARNGGIPGRDIKGAVSFPHHGSLSRELRRGVEKGLAEGRIPCVVATASLELGIDIGDIDEVILAGSCGNVSQALQRIGRAGHSVGQTSRGKLFAFHGKDLLIASALKQAVDERDIEEIKPIENPLDILAQMILSLCCEKDWNINELYERLKYFYIFRNLSFDLFNRVLRMLAGFGEKTKLRDIKPRIWIDNIDGKTGRLDGTNIILYSSGGVITNRGMYSLRLMDGTKIGELDEEFTWERAAGDSFDFGGRGWKIDTIGSESVTVTPLNKTTYNVPFWKADVPFRSPNLINKILAILERYNHLTETNTDNLSPENLKLTGGESSAADKSLVEFLNAQKGQQKGLPLPDTKNIIIEIIKGTELNRDFCSVVMHNFRGGKINYPLCLSMSAELEEIVGLRVSAFSNDDNILFLIPRFGIEEAGQSAIEEIIRRTFTSINKTEKNGLLRAERLFRNRLESSGVFGAAFREAAERSLLLPKAPFGKRTPLWIMRQRAKRLFDSVAKEDGFPVTAEAWRSCLTESFDMDGFRDFVSSINNGSLNISFFQTASPSPLSRDIVREETNSFMYEYDQRSDLAGSKSASLSDKVIEEAVNNAALRPLLKAHIVDGFTSRLRREIQGYAPDDALSLNEWVKERIAIPIDEWQTLKNAMPSELAENADTEKIKTVKRNNMAIASIVHREWEETWNSEPLSVLGQWLRYEGPVSLNRICSVFGVTEAQARDAIGALIEVDEAVDDVIIPRDISHNDQSVNQDATRDLINVSFRAHDSQSLICDRENLEMILRISRKKERPEIKERPAQLLIPFLALRHGLMGTNEAKISALFNKNLFGYTAPAKLWETEILRARNSNYDPEKTEREIREGKLIWYGEGKERLGFCCPEDLDLVLENNKKIENRDLGKLLASSFFLRPRDFWEIKNELNTDSVKCAQALWNEVWNGALTADSFDPVRKGIDNGYIPKEMDITRFTQLERLADNSRPFNRSSRVPSALKNRWRQGAPVCGNWYSILPEDNAAADDPMEEDMLNRDRVRLLLSRWGILARPLFENESAVFSWSRLLPVMRRMELSGELVTGRFFSGINSLQFASPSIARDLEQAQEFGEIYWMNAADPASLAGLDIGGLKHKLCARSQNNRIYFKGSALIAVSAKNGKELQIKIKENDPDIASLIALFKIPRIRAVSAEKKIVVEKINGDDAARSVYAYAFMDQGYINDRGRLIFW